MAIAAKDWTVSAMAVELGKDKRTIGKVIAEKGVEPFKVSRCKRKIKYYRMAAVVNAMISSTELTLEEAKTLESIENTRKKKRENDIEERRTITFDEVTGVLLVVAKQISTVLDSIAPKLKRQVPILSSKDIDLVNTEIAKCKNAMAGIDIKKQC